MKRVPPELDGLMWTLAEEGNERAIDEFGARHVEYRSELLHRIAMVKGLRGEKTRTAEPVKTIPRFVPKEAKSSGPTYIVSGLVLAAIGAMAYAVTIMLPPAAKPAPQAGLPVRAPQPVVDRPLETPLPRVDDGNKLPGPAPRENDAEPLLKSATLKVDHAPLLAVLELMAEKCGIRIDPAPGMPNPDVVVDYRDMNAMEMLQDLGRQFGFTPLNQHDGSILVVPAVDHSLSPQPVGEPGRIDRQRING